MPTGLCPSYANVSWLFASGRSHGSFGIPALADLGLTLDQLVSVVNRCRHEGGGLVGRVAEHQALVTRSLVLGARAVDALRDVAGLLANDVDDAAGLAVETRPRTRCSRCRR